LHRCAQGDKPVGQPKMALVLLTKKNWSGCLAFWSLLVEYLADGGQNKGYPNLLT
jgi:hypothetical protein